MTKMQGTQKQQNPIWRILVTDKIDRAGLDALSAVGEVDVKTGLSEHRISEIIGDYHAMMVRSGTVVTSKIIACGNNLKIIGRAGVGVDNIEVRSATEHGIFVVNSPLGNVTAAAEHTIALAFSAARHVTFADASLRQLKWERSKFVGEQLSGKTIGIIGLGQVGTRVAHIAKSIGMKVISYDPYVNEKKARTMSVNMVSSTDELLKESDVVTLHVPLVAATRNLINVDSISKMKKNAILVNCSRGGVVNEDDLSQALREGRLRAAALDVFEVENSFPADSPLLSCPNLVLTPHLGASTREAQVNVAVDVANQIVDCLRGKTPATTVNFPFPGVTPDALAALAPQMTLARRLGCIASQLLKGPITEVEVCASLPKGADDPHVHVKPLALTAAAAALGKHTADRVNTINVEQRAAAMSVDIIEKPVSSSDEHGSVQVLLRSCEAAMVVQGSAQYGGAAVTRMQSIPVFMPMPKEEGESHCIFLRNDDVPGVLHHVTGILSAHHLNIANCCLGRSSERFDGKREALAILQVEKDSNNMENLSQDFSQHVGVASKACLNISRVIECDWFIC